MLILLHAEGVIKDFDIGLHVIEIVQTLYIVT